jgi:hypothetical protein
MLEKKENEKYCVRHEQARPDEYEDETLNVGIMWQEFIMQKWDRKRRVMITE